MSNLINKVKDKVSGHSSSGSGNANPEPAFSIQPHPAKTNDPADLQPSGPGAGLRNDEHMAPFHARDPHIPTDPQVRANLAQQEPMSREQLHERQEQLNSGRH